MEHRCQCPPAELEQVMERYGNTVYRLAYSQTRSKTDAEDIYQDVFLRYFRKRPEFESEEHRKAWIIRTTLICCKRYWSASFRKETLSLEEITDVAALPEEEKGVLQALFQLPEKYRLPLELYYVEGLTAEECAKVLKIRPVAFRVRISRGKTMLKEKLKGEGIYVE